MRAWNPTNAAAMSRWLRASRTQADPVREACAVEAYSRPWRIADLLRAIVCVAGCAAIGALLAQAV